MPVACLAVPHFALRVAVLARPELDGAPLVLAAPPGARPQVLDASPEAAARGVRPGMGLREVPLLCPDAVILPPHPAREAAAAERVLAGLAALSPAVEPDAERPGHWYVDLRGSERSLGPPAEAAARLLATAPPLLRPRVGVGPGKFAARVAAAGATTGGGPVVAGTDVAAFLAPAPAALLPLPPETVRRMERLGLRTLGELAALPPAAVRARFGPDGGRARDLAAGIDPDPVRPLPPPEVVSAALDLPAPATTLAVLKLAVRRLAARAFSRPELRGRHARQARLLAALDGGGSWEVIATLREPGGEERVARALGYKLDGAELPGPVERLALDVVAPIDAAGRQEGLPGLGLGLRSRRPREVVEAARQLSQRFGSSGLYRAVEVEPWSRIPERRMGLLAFDP